MYFTYLHTHNAELHEPEILEKQSLLNSFALSPDCWMARACGLLARSGSHQSHESKWSSNTQGRPELIPMSRNACVVKETHLCATLQEVGAGFLFRPVYRGHFLSDLPAVMYWAALLLSLNTTVRKPVPGLSVTLC